MPGFFISQHCHKVLNELLLILSNLPHFIYYSGYYMNTASQNKLQERYKKLSNELASARSKLDTKKARNADQTEIDALDAEIVRLTTLITEIIMSDNF